MATAYNFHCLTGRIAATVPRTKDRARKVEIKYDLCL